MRASKGDGSKRATSRASRSPGQWAIAALFAAMSACGSGDGNKPETPTTRLIVEVSPHADDREAVDDAMIDAIRARPGVAEVVPRLDLAFSAQGSFSIGGKRQLIEVICDGIDPALVADEVPAFKDGTQHRVPILIHPLTLEIYNTQHAPGHDLPTIDVDQIDPVTMANTPIEITMGESLVSRSPSSAEKRFTVEGTVVGIHDKAMTVGMTVPVQYVRRWNARMMGDEAPRGYSKIQVTLESGASLPAFQTWAESKGLRAEP